MFTREKPYYTLNDWCMEQYGEKLYKIALDAGFTCPTRDGTLGTGGCIFCSSNGSGDFAAGGRQRASAHGSGDFAAGGICIREQLAEGRRLLAGKKTGSRYIAYFQAYTNTYGPLSYLEQIYTQALVEPDIAGISIATRPDCLPDDVLALLSRLRLAFPHKFIWVELGLQTIHETTAQYIRRGYPLSCFDDAVRRLHAVSVPVIVHIILGLPGENEDMVLSTVRHLNRCGIWGVKLQLLHVLRGTDLARDYADGKFRVLTLDEYLELLMNCIGTLSPDIVIHRVTGDGPKELLIAPDWSRNKRNVLNMLHHRMKQTSFRQGQYYESGTCHSV